MSYQKLSVYKVEIRIFKWTVITVVVKRTGPQ